MFDEPALLVGDHVPLAGVSLVPTQILTGRSWLSKTVRATAAARSSLLGSRPADGATNGGNRR